MVRGACRPRHGRAAYARLDYPRYRRRAGRRDNPQEHSLGARHMIVRSQADIDALREGGRRLARHVRILGEMVKPGLLARELEYKARELVKADGDTLAFHGHRERKTDVPYPSGLCLSVNDIIVHSPASQNESVLEEGDVVCLDFGIKHKGLYTDHAATVIAGTKIDPNDE